MHQQGKKVTGENILIPPDFGHLGIPFSFIRFVFILISKVLLQLEDF